MRMTKIGLGCLIVVVAACGGAQPAPDAQQTPTPQQGPQNAAQAGQQMADALKQMGQSQQNVTMVDFEKLISLLPEAPGWTRSTPKGGQYNMVVQVSRAEATYENGETSVKVEITDTSFNQLILAPMSMMLMSSYNERTSDGYKKAAPIGGSPGFEQWENDAKEAEVTVVVGNRFIVSAHGRNLENADAARSLVQLVDLAKLAALK